MNNELTAIVFNELATIKGLRNTEGTWVGSWSDLRNTVKESMKMVTEVATEVEASKDA